GHTCTLARTRRLSWPWPGASPAQTRAAARPARAPAPLVALVHTASNSATVPPPRARVAGPHHSWYHQPRLRVSVFSLQGGLTYVADRHTADLDPVPGPAGDARHF